MDIELYDGDMLLERANSAVDIAVQSISSAANFGLIVKRLESLVIGTQDAEERAEAKRYLAESKKFAEEMKSAPKPDLGPVEGGSRKEERSVMRLTRIGDCKG